MFDSSTNKIALCSMEYRAKIDGHGLPKGCYGYQLLGGHLVSLAFLERIEIELLLTDFDPDTAFSPRDMVGEDFWKALSPAEQAALPACLFQLIGEGRILFKLPEDR